MGTDNLAAESGEVSNSGRVAVTDYGELVSTQGEEESLEEGGLDTALLEKIHRELAAESYGLVDRFLMIQNGRVILDHSYEHDYEQSNMGRNPTPHQYNYYDTDWHPYYKGSDLHTLQSVTKSITSVMVGVAIQRGELPGTGVRALDFFGDYEVQNLDKRKRRMILEDLLTMRAGFDWDEWSYPIEDPRNACAQLEASDDWVQFVLDHPMAHEPGEVFVYNSGATQLLSVIIKKATGRFIDEYAEEHLFAPLGITEYYWKKTPKGWPDTEGGLYLKAEDLAKIGLLTLHGGVWGGEQVLSTEWIEQSTSPKVSFLEDSHRDWSYGYLWWLTGGPSMGVPRVYSAQGYGGQFLLVVPELDLIAVFNGWNIYGHPRSGVIDLFMEDILSAFGSS